MKVYAKQINPEYQESYLFDDDGMGTEYINVCGNKDFQSRTSKLFDRVKECLDNVEEAVGVVKKNGIETQDAFIECVKRKIEAQDHIQLTWIEYLKYIRPTLIDACWESRKAFAEKREQIRQERKAQRDAEDQKYVAERNAEMEKQIAAAYEVIRNGGTLENSDVSIYESRYNSHTYKIVNYLFRQHGINCPIKTQGWINERLSQVTVTPEGIVNVRFWKTKNGKCSEKVFDCLFELVRIVRAENQISKPEK